MRNVNSWDIEEAVYDLVCKLDLFTDDCVGGDTPRDCDCLGCRTMVKLEAVAREAMRESDAAKADPVADSLVKGEYITEDERWRPDGVDDD